MVMGSSLLLFTFICELLCTWLYHALSVFCASIVLWCVSSGHSCGKEVCKTWNEYFDNLHKCRTNGAVDFLTTFFLSFIPFTGLNNFYKGDLFVNWLME